MLVRRHLLVYRHGGGGAARKGSTTGDPVSLHFLLSLILIPRGHVTVLTRRAAVAGDGLPIASTYFLHSFLVLERLPNQTLCLRILQRTLSDGAPSRYLVPYRGVRVYAGSAPGVEHRARETAELGPDVRQLPVVQSWMSFRGSTSFIGELLLYLLLANVAADRARHQPV